MHAQVRGEIEMLEREAKELEAGGEIRNTQVGRWVTVGVRGGGGGCWT
jgi:hypothetical protein